MPEFDFKPWPKIARLNRGMVVTEKIDGTNACVYVSDDKKVVGAQSRTRIITPDADNYGFARWVYDNAGALADDLGPGYHYGEWWGKGVQRGYGIDHKRFSLFNTSRWSGAEFQVGNLGVVPVLTAETFDAARVNSVVGLLRNGGSWAAPGYMNPEGVVVFLPANQTMFKVLAENDDRPKGV